MEAKPGGRADANEYVRSASSFLGAQCEHVQLGASEDIMPGSTQLVVCRSRIPFEFKIIGWNRFTFPSELVPYNVSS